MLLSISQRLYVLALLFVPFLAWGQPSSSRPFFEPADSLDKTRFWVAAGGGAALYSASAIGLWQIWYKDYDLTGFHTFNDIGEWEQMDKIGHSFTTYLESSLIYQGARWTGLGPRPALWTGIGAAMLLQSTIEVMDGFSAKWGFSWSDMGANALGAGLFAGQELLWGEQRLVMKVSNSRPAYPVTPVFSPTGGGPSITPRERAYELFGVSFAEAFLKDYNGMTLWLSVNPSAFLGTGASFPRWLNLAVGYGAENMYSGIPGGWTDDNGLEFRVDPILFPRYRQFYLSLDIDLTRIRTRSRLLRTVFASFNWIKIPAPALEVNTRGGVIFRPFYW